MGKRKKKGQVLVGFALETNNEKEYALEKLAKKNADMIVLNSLNDEGAGFGHDTNKITIFEKGGEEIQFDTKIKNEVAKDIVDTIIRFIMHKKIIVYCFYLLLAVLRAVHRNYRQGLP